MSEKDSKYNKKRGFSFGRSVEKINDAYERSLEKNDPIYLEPIHKIEKEIEGEKILRRGGIDVFSVIFEIH